MPVKNQKGFTLLELIVTVAIIGVLAAISIPQYNKYRLNSELAGVLSNCRSLFRALTLYYMENDSMYPANPGETGDIDDDFNVRTFTPLLDSSNLGGIPFEIEINQLKKNLDPDPACPTCPKRVYFSDTGNDWQNFYFVTPWAKDPGTLIIVSASDNVTDADGNLIDGGNYLDGVFIWRDGRLAYR